MSIDNSPDVVINPICKRIKELREDRGWNQRELASAAGIHPNFINRVEAGKGLSLDNLCKIFDALGVSIEEPHEERGAPAFREDRLAPMYGRMRPESRKLLEEVLADREGRSYLLEQARFSLSRRKGK